jgi:hypothetical protein
MGRDKRPVTESRVKRKAESDRHWTSSERLQPEALFVCDSDRDTVF